MLINRYALKRHALNPAREAARRGEQASAVGDGAVGDGAVGDRLLVTPLAGQLGQYWGGRAGMEKLTRYLLGALREEYRRGAPLTHGYAISNLLTLLQQYHPETQPETQPEIQDVESRVVASHAAPGLKISPSELLDRRISETT